jgi:multiple sugar transport system permease protein
MFKEMQLQKTSAMRLTRQDRKQLRTGLAFISPWIVGFLVLTVYPIFISLYYSFTDFALFHAPNWVGLQNYIELFTKDDKFFLSLYNTVFFFLLVMPASVIAALALAILLNSHLGGRTFFRSLFFLPTIVPAVASAAVWMWILNPQ